MHRQILRGCSVSQKRVCWLKFQSLGLITLLPIFLIVVQKNLKVCYKRLIKIFKVSLSLHSGTSELAALGNPWIAQIIIAVKLDSSRYSCHAHLATKLGKFLLHLSWLKLIEKANNKNPILPTIKKNLNNEPLSDKMKRAKQLFIISYFLNNLNKIHFKLLSKSTDHSRFFLPIWPPS